MKRTLALIALTVFLLSGCSGKKTAEGEAGILEQAGGIAPECVLLTVDGKDVSAQQYLYWLADTCGRLTEYYQSSGKTMDWDAKRGGETIADYARQQAVNTAALYAEIEVWADRYHCTLSDEEQQKMEQEWEERVSAAGGEEMFLKPLGIDRATARQYTQDYCLYSQLYKLFCTEGSELHPEESAVHQFAQTAGLLTADAIFVAVPADADDSARKEKKERAEMVLSKLKASSDPAGYFSTLAGSYSDDAEREDHPAGFTFSPGDGTLPEEAEKAAEGLSANQWSEVLETADGYCIVLRRELNQEDVLALYFDHLLQEAADNAEIHTTAEYRSLSPEKFYTRLTDLRSEDASAAAQSAGEQASPEG